MTIGGEGGLPHDVLSANKMSVYTDNTVWHRASGESRYNLRSSNELSMNSSLSGITADTRVVASQKQR